MEGFRKNLSAKETIDIRHKLAAGHSVQLPEKHGRRLGSKRLRLVLARADESVKTPEIPTTKTIQIIRPTAPKYIKPPDSVHIPEKVLQAVIPMSENGFETWLCGAPSDGQHAEIRTWANQMQLAANMIGQRRDLAANFKILNTCCEKYKSLLRFQNQNPGANSRFLVWVTYIANILLCNAGADLANTFVRYLKELCAVELGKDHLVTLLWCDLLKMGVDLSRMAILTPMREQLMTMIWRISNGETFISCSTSSSMLLLAELNAGQEVLCDVEDFITRMRNMEAHPDQDRGALRVKVEQARLVISTMLGGRIKHQHSVELLREIEKWYGDGKGDRTTTGLVDYSGPLTVDFHQAKGELEEVLGWYSNAEASFRRAFNIALEQKAHNFNRMLWICSTFEDFYRRRGDLESAEGMRKIYLSELHAHITEG